MGHDVDPNKYDKFYMDTEYVLAQYRIAEKYLNILSQRASVVKEQEEYRRKAEALEEKMLRLEKELQEITSKL